MHQIETSHVELQTKRFVLRDFVLSDTQAFLAYHEDLRSSEFYQPHEATREHAEGLMATFRVWAMAQPRKNFQVAVVRRSEPHDLIGCVGLRTEHVPQNEAEFGIEIAPQYWGRTGYAIEIGNAMLDYGFTDLRLHAITGTTDAGNIRIKKLATWYGAEILPARPGEEMNRSQLNQLRWRLTCDQWRQHVCKMNEENA